jgi:hypothetical protein
MDPARMFKESLTSRPELENSQGQSRHFGRRPTTSGLPLETDIVRVGRNVSKVPTADSCTAANNGSIRSLRRPE